MTDTYCRYLDLQSAAGRTAATMRTYRWYVTHLRTLTCSDPAGWDEPTLMRVLTDWQDLSPSSRQQRAAILRGLLHTAGRQDLLELVPAVRRSASLPRPAPQSAVDMLWRWPDGPQRRAGLLAAYAGLRVAECAAARWSDVDGTTLHVVGKGRRSRALPLPALLAGELRRWPRRMSPWIVIDRRGRPYMPQSLDRVLNTALPDGVTAHMLRHYYATRCYRHTHDLAAVQRLLGHASPTTTAGYVLLDDRAMRDAVGWATR